MKITKTTITKIRTYFHDEDDYDVSVVSTVKEKGREIKLMNERDDESFIFKTMEFDRNKKDAWIRILKLMIEAVKSL